MTQKSEYDNLRDEFTKGYVQVYTGNGKGKTTAAIGLAVRALGAGLRVFFAQFIKGGRYSEIEMLEDIASRSEGALMCKQYGTGCFIMREPSEADRDAAREGVRDVLAALRNGSYQLVILDEANVAVSLGLLDEADLLRLIEEKPDSTELVFTGRNAPPKLIERADLVTEMTEVKHYYQKGVMARKGIES